MKSHTKWVAAGALVVVLVGAWSYSYALRYVAGYLDMTAWANPSTMSNLTIGVLGVFIAFGAVIGYMAPKTILWRLPKGLRELATICVTGALTTGLCYLLSLCGLAGFQLW